MGALATQALSILQQIRYAIQTASVANSAQVQGTSLPWRPPQWPASQSATLTLTATDPNTGVVTAYVFDGIFRAEHDQRSVVTLNPVQTGASISDNLYTMPRTLTAEIAVSDSMQSFTLGQFSDHPSRSVSAYLTLVNLQRSKAIVRVATRLNAYDKMVISNVRAEESKDTRYSMVAVVTFTELLLADVQQQTINTGSAVSPNVSSLPQVTQQAATGQLQNLPVPSAVQSQDYVVGSSYFSQIPLISGAGNWTTSGQGPLGLLASGLP